VVSTNLAIALSDLGTQVKAAGRLAEAITLYERALALAPRYADAHYNLGGWGVTGLECPGHSSSARITPVLPCMYPPLHVDAPVRVHGLRCDVFQLVLLLLPSPHPHFPHFADSHLSTQQHTPILHPPPPP
jgi:hypothetical protein